MWFLWARVLTSKPGKQISYKDVLLALLFNERYISYYVSLSLSLSFSCDYKGTQKEVVTYWAI